MVKRCEAMFVEHYQSNIVASVYEYIVGALVVDEPAAGQ